MQKRRTAKYYIRQIHLWLGLASGGVVLIVSLTGCIFVFQKEITEARHPEWYFVTPAGRTLQLDSLRQTAQAALGTAHPLSYIVAWRDPAHSWEFMSYRENDTALTIFGGMEYYQSVFLDPHTGRVTGFRDYKYDFFSIVKYLHWSLLLNTPYGQPIVAGSTVVFAIGLITGLVLWWPKKWTKAMRDRSFKIKWKTSFRRVNYDLHNVPGFYSLIPALIIAVTGLIFVWPPPTPPPPVTRSTPPSTATRSIVPPVTTHPLDLALHNSLDSLPAAVRFGVSPAFGKEGPIHVYAYRDHETYFGFDVLQFDRYSGRTLDHLHNEKKTKMQRLVETNYDLHVGAIAGLTGKIIAFIVSLICASLPVTGFLIWYLKRRKPLRQGGPKIA
ncbi:MAG TPA: PepSY-associated TM helix domain-containing protein [Puia sp.]|uniref:PepSY-associated TM helix domain-containing protein n=1 Tax=Puia sp. TaxID=2045100 RepID=UPI002CE9B677|nr:PepSY-associated TM helix domain-containing protein [Puia sp.]HVU99140.1 PepSY-associated TM helix domain-containing protein [Puia sp.]